MASPSFVYAFDNLGPAKFVELCALLLGARFKGFLLSSPGSDGGVDAENDPIIGRLRSEEDSLIVNTILPKNEIVVFQFKHKVAARVGEVNVRRQLLNNYKTSKKPSEVTKPNIKKLKPSTYVLVTNVEVNSNFRQTFQRQCKNENPDISNYQVIGLDELEVWVTSERELRSLYFPTIFGKPRFNLKLKLTQGLTFSIDSPENIRRGKNSTCSRKEEILVLSVMNIGEATSYLASIKFKILKNNEVSYFAKTPIPKEFDPLRNPTTDEAIEPGKCLEFRFPISMFREEFALNEYFLSEVIVIDQIDNQYSFEFSNKLREMIFKEK